MTTHFPNLTARLKIKYRSGLHNHSVTLRGTDVATISATAYQDAVQDFVTAMAHVCPSDFTIQGVETAELYDNVFLPAAFTYTFTPGATAPTLGASPLYMSFSGKSTNGNKANVTIMGIAPNYAPNIASSSNDYRINEGELSDVANILAALDNLSDFGYIALDSHSVLWYRYANVGFNSYWERQARR